MLSLEDKIASRINQAICKAYKQYMSLPDCMPFSLYEFAYWLWDNEPTLAAILAAVPLADLEEIGFFKIIKPVGKQDAE